VTLGDEQRTNPQINKINCGPRPSAKDGAAALALDAAAEAAPDGLLLLRETSRSIVLLAGESLPHLFIFRLPDT
jgi:hypothetical protein